MTDHAQPPLHTPQDAPYRWQGVEEHAYKDSDGTFLDVTRRVLCRDHDGQGVEVRYFEVGPGGHTTLEKHEHTHIVIPLRGRGHALVHDRVVPITMHDVIYVPSWSWHQFRADADDYLGMLCTVPIDRDRPTLPTAQELHDLRNDPAIREFIRTAADVLSI
jgi:mannose-6-phosphate isomerase-like protein (cupin superfamily)